MKKIRLGGKKGNGFYAFVDNEDILLVNKYRWHIKQDKNTFYARTNISIGSRKTTMLLHRLILGINDSKIIVDHKDHNGLNCTRDNLRICTSVENSRNRLSLKSKTSIYKGVFYFKPRKKWFAQITANGKLKTIGSFKNEIDAARAYDIFARNLFGEFAYTNFD